MKYPLPLAQRSGNKLPELQQLMDRQLHYLKRMTKVTSMVFTLHKGILCLRNVT